MTSWATFDTWADPAAVRSHLAAGADPDEQSGPTRSTPLHSAVWWGTPETVQALASAARTPDTPDAAGRSPLWHAVRSHEVEMARALLAAGAQPGLAAPDGRSPGLLALSTPAVSALFAGLPGAPTLTPEQEAEQAAADRLIASFEGGLSGQGLCVAFIAGLSADEVVHRLGAVDSEWPLEEYDEALWEEGTVGLSEVEGGTVLHQFCGLVGVHAEALRLLSRGCTVASTFDNPKGGVFPMLARDGEVEHLSEPMDDPRPTDPQEAWLYRFGDCVDASDWMARSLALAAALTGIRLPEGSAWFGRQPQRLVDVPDALVP